MSTWGRPPATSSNFEIGSNFQGGSASHEGLDQLTSRDHLQPKLLPDSAYATFCLVCSVQFPTLFALCKNNKVERETSNDQGSPCSF